MKSIIFVVAFLVAAAQAGPVVKDESKKNETLPVEPPKHNSTVESPKHNVTAESVVHHRVRRDCGAADLDRIQAQITKVLEEQIEKLLGGKIPEHHNRTRRAVSEAAASSKVNADGSIKTAAAAKSNNDSPSPVVPENPTAGISEPILTNGHQLPPVVPESRVRPEEDHVLGGAPGGGSELPPPPKVTEDPIVPAPVPAPVHGVEPVPAPGHGVEPVPAPGHGVEPVPAPGHGVEPVPAPGHGGEPAPAVHPVAGTGNTIQKVASKANMNTGTAVASAIAKRAAVLQTVDTTGGKAVANAESHKGADQNIQSVSASGTHVGIANALVDNRNASGTRGSTGPELVLQNVAATGSKAVATATNNKGSGSGVQEATADGDDISIAAVTSSRVKRETLLITSGDISIPEELEGTIRSDDDQNQEKLILLDRHRQTRSPCISPKMDENLRHLIEETVANAFADVRKELKL